MLDAFLLVIGVALLLAGGEAVVRGSTGLARALGVSPLAIGLTVVAFGTSAPELAVNVTAAVQGRGDICFGNIFGSNMANIGLIIGITAMIRPILIHRVVILREIPMMLLATAAALVMAFDRTLGQGPEEFNRGDGILLLLFFLVFLYYTVGDFAAQRSGNNDNGTGEFSELPDPSSSRMTGQAILTFVGLAGLIGGAKLTVDAGVAIARALGVPEVIIGLTLISVGTSLPELVASLIATFRGHVELAVGNIVGSNIFNILLVAGFTATVRPIPVPAGGHLDLLVVAALSLVLFGVSTTQQRVIIRGEAGFLLISYLGYLVWRSVGSGIA